MCSFVIGPRPPQKTQVPIRFLLLLIRRPSSTARARDCSVVGTSRLKLPATEQRLNVHARTFQNYLALEYEKSVQAICPVGQILFDMVHPKLKHVMRGTVEQSDVILRCALNAPNEIDFRQRFSGLFESLRDWPGPHLLACHFGNSVAVHDSRTTIPNRIARLPYARL